MAKTTRRGRGKILRLKKEVDKGEVGEKEEKEGNGSNKKGNKMLTPPVYQQHQGWLIQPRVWLCAYCPVGFFIV